MQKERNSRFQAKVETLTNFYLLPQDFFRNSKVKYECLVFFFFCIFHISASLHFSSCTYPKSIQGSDVHSLKFLQDRYSYKSIKIICIRIFSLNVSGSSLLVNITDNLSNHQPLLRVLFPIFENFDHMSFVYSGAHHQFCSVYLTSSFPS